MKRKLLTGAALLCSIIAMNAQEQVITSFEASETEGYTVGDDISSYSDTWDTRNTATSAAVESGQIVITDEWASDGDQSLKFTAIGDLAGAGNQLFSPIYNFSSIADIDFQLGADFYTDDVSDTSSNLWFTAYTYPGTGTAITRVASVQFDYNGEVLFWDSTALQTEEADYGYQSVGFEFAAEETYTMRMGFDNTAGTISYYANGDAVYTFEPATAVDLSSNYVLFIMQVDDYESNWYTDKVSLYAEVAGVKEQSLSQFAVYPNPANNIVNVSNDNAIVKSVSLVDVNGRTVKTASFDGVTSAQVNISDLANGVYMMNITSDKGSVTKKVVKN